MNEPRLHSDETLEAMLARRAAGAVPDGLADDIASAALATPQRHRAPWSVLAPPADAGPAVRRAWIVALAALLVVALSAAALVGSELVRRPELAVVPSPPDVVEPTTGPSPTAGPSAAPSAAPVVVSPSSPIEQLRELAFAPDGTAWLTTGAGVVHWDVAGGTATLYGQADGLPTTDTVHLAVAPDGTAWASGPGPWVARFDGSWTVFTELGGTEPAPDLGAMAAGPDGALWLGATDATSGAAVLLRYDGTWRSYALPEEINATPWAHRMSVDADGVVWAGSWDRFFRFDGDRWTTYARAGTGLPRDPVLAAVGADRSVWVNLDAEGCVAAAGGGATCATPAAGVARLRDGAWTVYSTSDGLPADDAALAMTPDGTPWAAAAGKVSRFDGAAWATTAVPELAEARLVAVDPDGSLWFDAADTGFLTYDGSTVTRRALPSIAVPSTLPELRLTELSGPTVTESDLGTITWRVYEGMTDAVYWPMTGTPHGPVVVIGPDLRWVSRPGVLAGTPLPIQAARFTSRGDEVIAYGLGVARLGWDGSRWAAVAELGATTGLAGPIEHLVPGPGATIATAGETIWFAPDGHDFATAAHPPDKAAGEKAWRAAGAPGGCPQTGGGSWPGDGQLGPAIATDEGFVVLSAARSTDWNRSPLCAPLLWSSRDGSTWTLVSGRSPFGDGAIVQDVASRDGRHVAVGQVGADPAAWVSDDGIAWRPVRLERAEASGTDEIIPTWGLMAGVEAADEGWLAWSWGGAAWTSRDGETWAPLRGWPAIRGGFGGPQLAVGGGIIVATGSLPGAWHDAIAIGTIER